MSEKNGKMKFKIAGKTTDVTKGKAQIKIEMDCPASFVIASIAHILVDKNNQNLAEAIKEAVTVANIAQHSPDPAATIEKLVKIKAGLCAGAEGDTEAGLAGLFGMLALLDEVINEKSTKGSEE